MNILQGMRVLKQCACVLMQLWGSTNYPPLKIDFIRIGMLAQPSTI